MQVKLHTYIGKFKVVHSEFNHEVEKIKKTGFNKLNANRYKHQATDQMAKVIKTDTQIKVQRLNNRKVQRLEAKLSKGLISLSEYKQGLAAL